LKWYWWRFNGYGYFWGMVSGIGSSLILPKALVPLFRMSGYLPGHMVNLEVSVIFPLVLVISVAGCLIGTLLTRPEDEQVLKEFYRRVRPWGFWGPILAKVRAEHPDFQPNRDFWRDMFNIAIGICWQIALVALPIYIVIRKFNAAALALATVAATSAILKFTWYDRLREAEHVEAPSALPEVPVEGVGV
jgi:hypothetical protein